MRWAPGAWIAAVLAVSCAAGGPAPSDDRSTSPDAAVEDARPPRLERSGLTVAVVSDLNGPYGATRYRPEVHAAIERIVEVAPDLVLSTGDMVAGQREGLDYRAMWSAFHDAVSNPLARAGIPFAVTPGNHDASGYPTFENERSIFAEEWRARRPPLAFVDDVHYPLRYAFVEGGALFVSLDATRIGPLDDAQRAWLEGVLAANATSEPKIVFGHLPLYPFSFGREMQALADRGLEELYLRHGVDLVISGHHHAYYPGRRGGLRLVGTSCLGSGPRKLLGDDRLAERSVLLFRIEDGTIAALDAHAGAGFDVPIPRSTLPPSVGKGSMTVRRDDL